MSYVDLEVKGMTCAACSARVERNLKKLLGVSSATVNLATERATVAYAPETLSLAEIVASIRRSGYAPVTQTLELAGSREQLEGVDGVVAVVGEGPTLQVEVLPGTHLPSASTAPPEPQHISSLGLEVALSWLLAVPLLALMVPMLWPAAAAWLGGYVSMAAQHRFQWLLATPIQFGTGRRFYRLGWHSLRTGSPDMNSLVMLGSTSAYCYSAHLTLIGAEHVYFEASGVVIAMLLTGRMMEERVKEKARRALSELFAAQSKPALRVRDGRVEKVPVEALEVGDRVRVLPGATVPTDGEVLEGESAVDESLLTGESIPVARGPGDRLVGGSQNTTGQMLMGVTAVGRDTVLARIVGFVQEAQGHRPPIHRLADAVVARFVPSVAALAVISALFWGFHVGVGSAVVHVVCILLVACPCAMGLATPISLLVGTTRAAQSGILFRSGDAIQTLSGVRAVAFDKTGTLTQGRLRVTEVWPQAERERVLALAAALEQGSEHPLAAAVLEAAEGLDWPRPEGVKVSAGRGVSATLEGRLCRVGLERFLRESGCSPSGSDAAGTLVWVALGEEVVGGLALSDSLKPESAAVVGRLRERGLSTAMLTGDRRAAAEPVARELGLDRFESDMLPEDKAAAVAELSPVAFVGDGFNDAPALARAEVGIALGTGAEIAANSADVVILGSNLELVERAIELSSATMSNIRWNLVWAFGYNIVLLPLAAFGDLPPVLGGAAMAFSSLFVLLNALRLRKA